MDNPNLPAPVPFEMAVSPEFVIPEYEVPETPLHEITVHDAMGAIQFTASVDDGTYNISTERQKKIDGHWDKEVYYVSDGQAVLRPTQDTVLNGMILTGMPVDSIAPVMLSITTQTSSETYNIVGETEVELDFPNAGQYVIQVTAFPYIIENFVVNV